MTDKPKIALYSDRGVIADESQANSLWNRGYFGELKDTTLQLSLIECVFLSESRRAEIQDKKGAKIKKQDMFKLAAEKYEDFIPKYNVYKDLRSRGHIVKTGFKFGTHFRMYERGKHPGKGHADFLVHVIPEDTVFELQELSRNVRLSRSVRKTIWYAVVDTEGDITYYQIVRIKP